MIDGDGGVRYVVDTVLSRKGYRVICAASVADGLRLLDKRPDWLIVDLKLPDGSGIDILREVRLRRLALRRVVITADASLLPEVEPLSPDGVAVKPLVAEELAKWMESVGRCDRSRGYESGIPRGRIDWTAD